MAITFITASRFVVSPVFTELILTVAGACKHHSWVFYTRSQQKPLPIRLSKRTSVATLLGFMSTNLLLLPRAVRESLPMLRLSSWALPTRGVPSSEVFQCLAMRQELLKGVLGANLVGL
jgi:trehalose 6-phosphate synthase/phosphatase